jgi:hypothetical protein
MRDDPAARLREIAERKGITGAGRHIFLCCDQTTPQCCDLEASLEAWKYLKLRLKELGLSEAGGVCRTKANCLRICEDGPIAVVYPEGTWYRGCDPPVRRASGRPSWSCRRTGSVMQRGRLRTRSSWMF